VHAIGRGNPRVNLSDGRDVPTRYAGAPELQQGLGAEDTAAVCAVLEKMSGIKRKRG
jgi:hypothetical protein